MNKEPREQLCCVCRTEQHPQACRDRCVEEAERGEGVRGKRGVRGPGVRSRAIPAGWTSLQLDSFRRKWGLLWVGKGREPASWGEKGRGSNNGGRGDRDLLI